MRGCPGRGECGWCRPIRSHRSRGAPGASTRRRVICHTDRGGGNVYMYAICHKPPADFDASLVQTAGARQIQAARPGEAGHGRARRRGLSNVRAEVTLEPPHPVDPEGAGWRSAHNLFLGTAGGAPISLVPWPRSTPSRTDATVDRSAPMSSHGAGAGPGPIDLAESQKLPLGGWSASGLRWYTCIATGPETPDHTGSNDPITGGAPVARSSTAHVYDRAGFGSAGGAGQPACGRVVDFSYGFTDPRYATGADMTGPVLATARLLEAARAAGLPVVFTTIAYDPARCESRLAEEGDGDGCAGAGNPAGRRRRAAHPRTEEHLVVQTGASAFFGTALASPSSPRCGPTR